MSRITTALTAGLVFLTLVTIGSSYQTYLLCQKTESLGAKVDEHMDDIYFLMKSYTQKIKGSHVYPELFMRWKKS